MLENETERLKMSLRTPSDLMIFQSVKHPSFQINNQVKEGFSIFNMFDFTVTSLGRAFLRGLFSFPLKNIDLIQKRTKSIKFLELVDKKSALGNCVLIVKL